MKRKPNNHIADGSIPSKVPCWECDGTGYTEEFVQSDCYLDREGEYQKKECKNCDGLGIVKN